MGYVGALVKRLRLLAVALSISRGSFAGSDNGHQTVTNLSEEEGDASCRNGSNLGAETIWRALRQKMLRTMHFSRVIGRIASGETVMQATVKVRLR